MNISGEAKPFSIKASALTLAGCVLFSACGANKDTSENSAASSAITTQTRLPTTGQTTVNETTSTAKPDEEPLPTDATALANELVETELAIRDPQTVDRPAWGRRQQRLYRTFSQNPEWEPSVTEVVSNAQLGENQTSINVSVEKNFKARQALDALLKQHKLGDSLPAWEVKEPVAASDLLQHYKSAETESGIEWEYLAAINLVETRMGRIAGLSTAGAVGPMQFLPTTWAECCKGDPNDPSDAISGAAKYLTDRGGPANMNKAIFGYNNSQNYVDAVSAYAAALRTNEQTYYGYHAWEIYFATTHGTARIPVGYKEPEPVPAKAWLEANPSRAE